MAAKSPAQEHPRKAFGWAARDTSGVLSPFHFSRRDTGAKDVRIRILYCGVCHSDLHFARNEWESSAYPIVPGHEIVGVATEIGGGVEKFRVGESVAVGCMVGGCDECSDCRNGNESYCRKTILTYNYIYHDGTRTYGGYSGDIVVEERYVLRLPDGLPMASSAPLLCAGITVYSPLKHFGLGEPGKRVGVVGLGGLGHVAVKFARALGAEVTVISTSAGKKEEAINRLGAHAFVNSRDEEQMKAAEGTLDGIIDTVSAKHSIMPLIALLKSHSTLVMVGAPPQPLDLRALPLLVGRKMVAGSATGGIKETQEMLNFAAKHGVTADVEVIPMGYINTAMERLARGDVKYRFVIDIASSLLSN